MEVKEKKTATKKAATVKTKKEEKIKKEEKLRKEIFVEIGPTGHVKLVSKHKNIPLDIAEQAINQATEVTSAWLNRELIKDFKRATTAAGLLILSNILFMILWLIK